MGKILRVVSLVALSLVLVAAVALVGCAEEEKAELEAPDMTLSQYLKGATADFDAGVINTMSEGGGQAGWASGTAAAIYPTKFAANRDAIAASIYGDTYHGWPTTYAILGAGEKAKVDNEIRVNVLTAAEQDAVSIAVVGFFDRMDNDMADAVAPTETSAYAILADVSATAAGGWLFDLYPELYSDANRNDKANELYEKTYAACTAEEKAAVDAALYADLTAEEKAALVPAADLADRFFVWLVKEFVEPYGALFMDFYVEIYGVEKDPTEWTDDEIEAVSRLAGEVSFTAGTASAMYPTQAEAKAQAMYGKSYAECSEMEAPYVDAAVYAALPSVFASDAVRDVYRDGTAAMLAAYTPLVDPTHTTYALCTGMEKAWVNYSLYVGLPDAARDGIAEGLAAAGIIDATHTTFAACTDAEKAIVNQAASAVGVPSGTALERDYIDLAAVPGTILGWVAEMTDALPLEQTMAYLTLQSKVSPAAAEGWKTNVAYTAMGINPGAYTDVCTEVRDTVAGDMYGKAYDELTATEKAAVDAETSVHPRQAFYRWLAKEGVAAMAAAAPLIRLSAAEFYVKVTNPNGYWISLDSLTTNFSIDVDTADLELLPIDALAAWAPADLESLSELLEEGVAVDVAKVVLNEKVWVPPMEDDVEGEITVRLLAPVKVYEAITWGVVAGGYSSDVAGALAAMAFGKIQDGTAVWDMTIDAVISAETGTITESYDLQWPTA